MGVYLSEPNKDKHFSEGDNKAGMSFVSAEMQGKSKVMQAGERPWKMQLSTISTLETEILSLQCLTDMEVHLSTLRLLGQ